MRLAPPKAFAELPSIGTDGELVGVRPAGGL